jgi:hypothetical protein
VFDSVRGLGHKLEAGKGPVETLVILSVEDRRRIDRYSFFNPNVYRIVRL